MELEIALIQLTTAVLALAAATLALLPALGRVLRRMKKRPRR